jgi:hypothetical protein
MAKRADRRDAEALRQVEAAAAACFLEQIDGAPTHISEFGVAYVTFFNGLFKPEGEHGVEANLQQAAKRTVALFEAVRESGRTVAVWRVRPHVKEYEDKSGRRKKAIRLRVHFITPAELEAARAKAA